MPTAEGVYPKVSGDPEYASERNKYYSGFITIFGDGSDGALNVTSGTTNLNLGTVYEYSSINISAGATLSTTDSSNYGKTLIIKCQGDCTIDGTINLSAKGYQGGVATASATNPQFFLDYDDSDITTYGYSGAMVGTGNRGGGGGASAINSGSAGSGGIGTNSVQGYKFAQFMLKLLPIGAFSGTGGSGGVGDGDAGAGGHGGGSLILLVGGDLTFSGTINVSGTNGTNATSGTNTGGGGGGGGGIAIILYSESLSDTGTKTVTGGSGGTATGTGGTGGAGGDGEIIIKKVSKILSLNYFDVKNY